MGSPAHKVYYTVKYNEEMAKDEAKKRVGIDL